MRFLHCATMYLVPPNVPLLQYARKLLTFSISGELMQPLVYLTSQKEKPYAETILGVPGIIGDVVLGSVPIEIKPFLETYMKWHLNIPQKERKSTHHNIDSMSQSLKSSLRTSWPYSKLCWKNIKIQVWLLNSLCIC